MALKLDMSKAYDRIEWSFIEAAMEMLGFSWKWIDLVITCVSTVSYSLLLNGVPQLAFQPSRGIRQDDPRSPFLFILCSETLCKILNKAEDSGLVNGIPMAQGYIHINHLFFADDSLLLCKASSLEWSSLLNLLELYEHASGQRLNKEKTSIFFSNNTKQESRDIITSIVGIRTTWSYEKYLGLLGLVGRSRDKAFKGILDRVRSKLGN